MSNHSKNKFICLHQCHFLKLLWRRGVTGGRHSWTKARKNSHINLTLTVKINYEYQRSTHVSILFSINRSYHILYFQRFSSKGTSYQEQPATRWRNRKITQNPGFKLLLDSTGSIKQTKNEQRKKVLPTPWISTGFSAWQAHGGHATICNCKYTTTGKLARGWKPSN